MKKSVLAALVGTLIAAPALAQSYDPAAQGALATDFIYGYFTGATFTQLVAPANYATGSGCYISTGAASSCLQAGGSSPFLGLYFTPTDGTSSGANLYASDVTFHPGGNGELAALAFVAPTAGDYRFTGFFRADDAPSGNGVTFTIPGGPNGTLGVRPSSSTFDIIRTLSAGDQAFFTVGNNGSYAYDTTGLQLNVTAVPEPATWGMMLAGLGMIGFGLRNRRKGQVETHVTFA